jgi:hypothetical protein
MLMIQTPPPLPSLPADPNFILTQVIPLVGTVAAMVVFAVVLRWLLHSPIGEALAEGIRLRRRRRYGMSEPGPEEPRVAALEQQVRQLSVQVSELGERLDFTERVLVEHRERRIGAGQ